MSLPHRTAIAILASLWAFGGSAVSAQPLRPALEMRLTTQPPVLDGKLDDGCWQDAPVLTNFTQVLPVEGAPPTERTEVRFLYTANYLYLGVRCFDTEPGKIIAKQMERDNLFESDDRVKIAFDTFFRQRDGYFFAVNPAGARTDGLIENFSDQSRLWDALWEARARIDDAGWTVEIAIPFKSLSFDPHRDTWGCNIERVIRRKQEIVRWTALSRSKSMSSLADFGELRGLQGMKQGLGLEARPFLSVKYKEDAVNHRTEWKFKPGGDLTYYLTPSLKANATFNTDFAEAEVDERVVNLSRFPLFFPEKRDFFLQDSSLFRFGGMEESPLPYYSRRIGLGAAGQPVDLIAGGRLTGRIGNTSVALLDVQQDSYPGVPSKNLFVGRVSTRVLEESNAGLILTHGDPTSSGDNTLGGFDFNYLNNRLPDGKQLVGHAWIMGTASDRVSGNGLAFGGDLDYPNEPLDVHVFFWQTGAKFDPALGFVERTGVREYLASVFYLWRPNTAWLRSVSLGARPYFTTDLNSRLVGEDHDVPVLTFRTPADDRLTLAYTFYRDVPDEPFEIHPGLVIPAGDYPYGQFKPSFQTSVARPVSVGLRLRVGDFYTGTQRAYGALLDWRPSRHLTTGLAFDLREIRLAEGSFDVRLASFRLNIAFTPDLTWSTVVQYDNQSNDAGLNSRIRWTYRPGSDVFFVVNQGWEYAAARFTRLSSEVIFKVGTTIRF